MPLTSFEKEAIERDVLLLKESMDTMHELVYFQGKQMDSIEDSMGVTKGDIEQGEIQLTVAEESSWKYTVGTVAALGVSGILTALLFLL